MGTTCPAFELEAIGSGRKVSPEGLAGRRVVLVLHGPRTTDAPKEVGKAVRAEFSAADDVFVANVVNLKSMGGLWKKVATAQMTQTYEKMGAKIEGDPADYVVLLPDWDNAVGPLFEIEDSNQAPAVAVLEDDGTILGVVTGESLGDQVMALLAQ